MLLDFMLLAFSSFMLLAFSDFFMLPDFMLLAFSSFILLAFSDFMLLAFSDFMLLALSDFMLFAFSDFMLLAFSDFMDLSVKRRGRTLPLGYDGLSWSKTFEPRNTLAFDAERNATNNRKNTVLMDELSMVVDIRDLYTKRVVVFFFLRRCVF